VISCIHNGWKDPCKDEAESLKALAIRDARKKIAEKVGIDEGTVTSIVQDAKENIPDVDSLHEVATKITRNNWDINIFFFRNQTSKNPL
jgi:transcriptional regulator with XRE-family HTH domain